MSVKWKTRPFVGIGDKDGILELRKVVFVNEITGVMSDDTWVWQFINNPSGVVESYLAVINYGGKEIIVGQYAVIPVDHMFNYKRKKSSLSLDTMTHPEYQRQGMFTKLASDLYNLVSNKGISTTIGFANDNSFPGFINKLGWQHICDIPLYVKFLKVDNISYLGKKPISWFVNHIINIVFRNQKKINNENLVVEEVSSFKSIGNDLNDLFKTNTNIYPNIRIRNFDFLQWRFVSKPNANYKIYAVKENGIAKGYIVLSNYLYGNLKVGAVVDVFVEKERKNLTNTLINKAIDYFKENEFDAVTFIMLANKKFLNLLKRSGFIQVPSIINPKKWHFIIRDHLDPCSKDELTDETRYYITWADTDVI